VVHPLGEDGKPRYGEVMACVCSREKVLRERYERMLRFCRLPAATEGWTFEQFDASGPLREAYTAALELAEERGNLKWLTLIGPVDIGKSHLAVAICRRWLDRGKPAYYVLVPLMLENLRACYEGRVSFDREFNFLLNVPLLVMDDLGSQKPSEWAMEKLMQIVDYRYMHKLSLVVTSNYTPANLPGDIEHRIGSRLLRADFGKVVVINAPEYRLRKGESRCCSG